MNFHLEKKIFFVVVLLSFRYFGRHVVIFFPLFLVRIQDGILLSTTSLITDCAAGWHRSDDRLHMNLATDVLYHRANKESSDS